MNSPLKWGNVSLVDTELPPLVHFGFHVSLFGTVGATVGIYFAAAVTPGPNLLYVAHTASATSRKSALMAAMGVASGSTTLAGISVLLIGDLLPEQGAAYRLLRLTCGLYLSYLGLRILRSLRTTDHSEPDPVAHSGSRVYLRGILTIVTNPKAMLFFGALTATVLPLSVPLTTRISAVTALALSAFSWYCLVAIAFSSEPFQRLYRRIVFPIDLLSGCFFLALGLYLAFAP